MAPRWRPIRCALFVGILFVCTPNGPLSGQTDKAGETGPAVKVFASFENKQIDLERGAWRGNVGGGTTTEHATYGKRSLWTVFGRAGAVLWGTSRVLVENWSGYEKLKGDFYIDGPPLLLDIQLRDKDGERYTVPNYYLRPGPNTLEIDLTGAAQVLDITHVTDLRFTAVRQPEGSNKTFIDNLRLTRGVPDTVPSELAAATEFASVVNNLVANPSFEYGLNNWQFWGKFDWGEYRAATASRREAHSGVSCASIHCTGYAPGRGGLATGRIWVPWAGDYRVTVFVKGKGGARFRLGLAHARFPDLSLEDRMIRRGPPDVEVTPDWQEISYDITVDDEHEPVRLWLYNVGMGTLYLDDVALVATDTGKQQAAVDRAVPKGRAEVRLSGDLMYVNGKPFYAVGVVGCDAPEEQLAQTGFTVAVAPVIMGSPRPFLDQCYKAGLLAVANLSEGVRSHAPTSAAAIARSLEDHPAVVGWFIADRPDGEAHPAPPPEVRLTYQSVRNAVGDDLPVLLRIGGRYPSSVYQYRGMSDIVMVSAGAVGNTRPFDLRGITQPVDRTRALMRGKGPVWAVLKVGGEGTLEPGPAELSVMTYLAVTHGANGVLWEPFGYIKEHPGVWQSLVSLAGELRQLTPALVSPTVKVITGTNKTSMHGTARRYQDQLYLILVNASNEAQPGTTFTLSGVPASAPVEVLFEDRTLTLDEGVLSDDFEPYERHVYRLAAPVEAPTGLPQETPGGSAQ